VYQRGQFRQDVRFASFLGPLPGHVLEDIAVDYRVVRADSWEPWDNFLMQWNL
jgi:hypothetical protein